MPFHFLAYLCSPIQKSSGYIMFERIIVKQLNADAQESSAATTEEATATTKAPEQAPEKETAHDDFDWSIDNRNVATYSIEE